MKKTIILPLFLIFFSCNQRKDDSVGNVTGQKEFVLKEKVKDSLTVVWNKMLVNDSISTTIAELKIIKDKDLNTQKEYYGILGTTQNDSAKVICTVELINDKFYFEKSEITTSIICFGSKNCNPKKSDGNWVCDDGTGEKKCSKDCMKIAVATKNN